MPINENELINKNSPEVKELQKQMKEKDRLLESYKQEKGKLDIFFRQVLKSISPVDPLKKAYKGPINQNSSSVCEAVMQISDGHMGAVQDPIEIENFNRFNPTVCRDRQVDFAFRVINWVEMHRTAYNIDNLTILVTGDLISGDIHEELRVTNAFPLPVQVVEAAKVLAEQITLLQPYFKRVKIEYIVDDNHARLTKKPQAKESGYNSMNYLIAILAEAYVKALPDVEFNIYPMHEKVVSVLNLRYLIAHGHGITGWMGVPWYSIQRHVGKEATARLQIIMEDLQRAKDIGFHKYVFGHWHTPFDSDLYACSGSVSGTDAYDHGAGRYAKPSQPAWIVHPKYGEFDKINFKLLY